MNHNACIMRCLELSLSDAAANLALDEALLEEAEAAGVPLETLRLWEFSGPVVVVGRSSQVEAEVHVNVCRQSRIPILRRVSGGAAVVAGPGCLMYSLVLSYQRRPALRLLSEAHRAVLGRLVAALSRSVAGVAFRGTSDLAIDAAKGGAAEGERHIVFGLQACTGQLAKRAEKNEPVPGREGHRPKVGRDSPRERFLKFSGNSVRCRRTHFLYHGTLLYDFPLPLIERCLKMPSRVPDYRGGRGHAAFVTNLPLTAESLRRALVAAWEASTPRSDWPREPTEQLACAKYRLPQWNGL